MRTYSFVIKGNHENKTANPLPYFRRTQGTKWSPESRRYEDWKRYVRSKLFDSGCLFTPTMVYQYNNDLPPLVLEKGEKARMDIFITWSDETHGDPDNVFKGIADAIFANDKHVAGSFDFCHGEAGLVNVRILILDSIVDANASVDLWERGLVAQEK